MKKIISTILNIAWIVLAIYMSITSLPNTSFTYETHTWSGTPGPAVTFNPWLLTSISIVSIPFISFLLFPEERTSLLSLLKAPIRGAFYGILFILHILVRICNMAQFRCYRPLEFLHRHPSADCVFPATLPIQFHLCTF